LKRLFPFLIFGARKFEYLRRGFQRPPEGQREMKSRSRKEAQAQKEAQKAQAFKKAQAEKALFLALLIREAKIQYEAEAFKAMKAQKAKQYQRNSLPILKGEFEAFKFWKAPKGAKAKEAEGGLQ
jgi:hypothetical protein